MRLRMADGEYACGFDVGHEETREGANDLNPEVALAANRSSAVIRERELRDLVCSALEYQRPLDMINVQNIS